MRSMTANEAKRHFGELLDTARREPVAVHKHGRPVTVMLSVEDYTNLKSKSERTEHWQNENREALESSNDHVEKHGLPLDRHRQF